MEGLEPAGYCGVNQDVAENAPCYRVFLPPSLGSPRPKGSRFKLSDTQSKKRKVAVIILAYPNALVAVSLAINLFALGIRPALVALPSTDVLLALSLSVILLLITHTGLMTSTELTRLRHDMKATPEEWAASKTTRADILEIGWHELERHHNAHRNATENIVYFPLLALVFCLISPGSLAAWVWILGFALGRFGHASAYLMGWDGLRGVFMSVSLTALYGMAGYVLLALLI